MKYSDIFYLTFLRLESILLHIFGALYFNMYGLLTLIDIYPQLVYTFVKWNGGVVEC